MVPTLTEKKPGNWESAFQSAGRQVPIFSYFSQHTPIFPIFQQFPPIFPIFLAILHLTCISFQGFLYSFSFFFSVTH